MRGQEGRHVLLLLLLLLGLAGRSRPLSGHRSAGLSEAPPPRSAAPDVIVAVLLAVLTVIVIAVGNGSAGRRPSLRLLLSSTTHGDRTGSWSGHVSILVPVRLSVICCIKQSISTRGARWSVLFSQRWFDILMTT